MAVRTFALCLLLCFGVCAIASASPLHILLIVADDLGWNDVDFHGSAQIPTPHLSQLAREGVILNNYYVQPVCSPTRSSILTGRHVIHSGIYDPDCSPGTTYSVPLNFTMIPSHLKQLNYESHAIGKWHLGMFTRQAVPTGKGFSSFSGYYGGAEDYFTHEEQGANDMHSDQGDQLSPDLTQKGEYSTFIYARKAVERIRGFDQRNDKALFMYLAFQAIHSPDQVPDQYRDRFNETIPDTKDGVGQHRRIVAGMVACLDEAIGNVTAALESAGMMQDTLILFTTDNGGPAQGFNDNMASNWPLRGMKRTLWQGGVRATGFAHGAGLLKTGYVSEGMMHATDWFPTLLTAAAKQRGLHDWRAVVDFGHNGVPAWQLGDGMDVWPMLSSGSPSPREEVLIEAHPTHGSDDGNGQAIVVGDFKLVLEKGPQWHGPPNDLWYESGSNPGLYNHTVVCGKAPAKGPEPPCLFNISADPCEYKDIQKEHPQVMQRLVQRLAAYQATAVSKQFHELPLCEHPTGKLNQPTNGSWMPVCP